jgi:quercetin dioxygenase-like cupin family protein
MRRLIFTAALIALAGTAQAQTTREASGPGQAIVVQPGGITWGPAPEVLPKGARAAVLEGDPAKAGEFTLRLWMPSGYRIPPHYHPAVEHVSVISGTFWVGMGDRFDESKLTALQPGAFGAIPIGMRHFAATREEVVIQLHGTGPWGLVYVNPADTPKPSRIRSMR